MLLCSAMFLLGQNGSTADQPTQLHPSKTRPPRPVNSPEAQIPDEALRAGLNGMCLVSLVVDARGDPQDPRIVRCTDQMFADNSLAAVRRYKFKPATDPKGEAVAVKITIEMAFRHNGGYSPPGLPYMPPPQVGLQFLTPPTTTSKEAGPDGVYPLTSAFQPPNDLPKVVKYHIDGLRKAASSSPPGTACDILLTIDAVGKPSDPKALHCDNTSLDEPAINALMKSKFKSARLNAKAVAVRTMVHLVVVGPDKPGK
jgi:protein TonB